MDFSTKATIGILLGLLLAIILLIAVDTLREPVKPLEFPAPSGWAVNCNTAETDPATNLPEHTFKADNVSTLREATHAAVWTVYDQLENAPHITLTCATTPNWK